MFTTPGLKRFAEDLDTERQAQLAKFGDQRHNDGTGAQHYVAMADEAREDVELFIAQHSGPEWALVLLEEVYEALAESDPAKLRTELVQAAAVIAAWVSDLDRRPPSAGVPFTAAELATAEADVAALDAEFPAELIPAWEAMYEPGNVSDYLIGYANSEAAAKGAAEAWLRSQKLDGVGRLEWVPDPLMAVREHDQWFELIEHSVGLGTTGTGINVRHRAEEQPS